MPTVSVYGALAHEVVVIPCMIGISLPVHIIYALLLGLENKSEICGAIFFATVLLLPNIDEIFTDSKTKNTMIRTAVNLIFFMIFAWMELWVFEVKSAHQKLHVKEDDDIRRLEMSVYKFGRSILYMTFGIRITLLSIQTVLHLKDEFLSTITVLSLGIFAYTGYWVAFAAILLIAMSFP